MVSPRVILIHPEPMPCIRNRAVFQRPLWFSKNTKLTLLTMSGVQICEAIACKTKIVRLVGKGRSWRSVWKVQVLIWLLWHALSRQERKEIVYVFPQWGWFVVWFASLLGYKVVVDMQHTPFYYKDYAYLQPLRWNRRLYYSILGALTCFGAGLAMKRLDLVVAMSHSIDDGFGIIFQNFFGVSRGKILAVPNGVDTDAQPTFVKKDKESANRFIYAGNIQQKKIERLIESLATLVDSGISIELHIAGSVASSYKKRFCEIIYNEKFNFVKYHGFISHDSLVDLYKKCGFGFFFVSNEMRDHKYSHPGKVLEYMLYGCIPIVSRIDSLERVIVNFRNGVLLDRDDELINCLVKLLNDTELLDKMREQAYLDVQKFDWGKINRVWSERVLAV